LLVREGPHAEPFENEGIGHSAHAITPGMTDKIFDQIRNWIREGRSGSFLTAQYTREIDFLIRDIFDSVNKSRETVLIATGGYGRGELAPFSDIDIMFFAPGKADTGTVERILYKLWDTKLDISHSFRTAAECVAEAFKDIRTRTSLLESRYIAGNKDYYAFFEKNVYPEIAFNKQKDFVREKLQEMEKRHLSSGDSIFLLEPHIKEGEGGLRDVHTAYWLSKVAFRTGCFSEFLETMAPYDRKRFHNAYDFLLRTRFSLHLESGRKNDRLLFEFQRNVANLIGFRDSAKFNAAERMMRYYYLKCRVIKDATREVISRCSSAYVRVFRDLRIKRVSELFTIARGNLVTTREDLFDVDPERIMEGFYLYSKTGKKFSPNMKEKVRANLLRINKKTRSSPEAVSCFLEILKGSRVYETLREMHETGVLGRFVPEFGALRLLVVHEPYHMYTVDEHTLLAIKNLEDLRTTRYKSLDDLHIIVNRMGNLDSLYMALLFHDIGKAAGRRHGEEGYKRLKNIMERFHLDGEKRKRIEFLVKNHILMSKTAMQREASDPEVEAAFADAVGDLENLDALYLITFADMSAVNPAFWTSWKSYLLRELYDHTRDYLSGIKKEMPEYIRSLQSISPSVEARGLGDFLGEMPARYILSTTRSKVLEDYKLVEEERRKGFAMRIDQTSDGVAEICISAEDYPGLFSRAVGFLSSKGLNIVNGRIFTGKKGIVIDKISVSNWKEIWWEGLPEDLEKGLKGVIAGEKTVTVTRRGVTAESPFDIFIELDNEASEEYSVIEIFSPDRIGLLYEISDTMYRQGINIISARINTETGLAEDVFYVLAENRKVDYVRAEGLLSELWTTLKGRE
jgi:[protein-PII] uridylyltransferase